MNFVAIDFETANRDPASACSVGVVVVKDGNIEKQGNWLINPHSKFEKRLIAIHGITEEMVKDAPTFKEIWESILCSYIENNILVAHNASFDINVLKNALESCKLPTPNFKTICTLQLSRSVFSNLENHKLPTVAGFLGIELIQHHNALSDALTTANILLKVKNRLGLSSVKDFLEEYEYKTQTGYSERIPTNYIDSDFWDELGYNMHFEHEQLNRIKKSAKLDIENIEHSDKIGIINSYKVSLSNCECGDFLRRRKPCKHMYRLALETKVFNTEILDFVLNSVEETMDTTSICNEIYEYITTEKPDGKEDIKIKSLTSYSSMEFFGMPVLRIKCGKSKSFISFKNTFKPLVRDYTFLKIEQLRSDELWFRIIINSKEDLADLYPLLLNVYDEAYLLVNAEKFSCCSRYLQCSDERSCIHPDKLISRGCTYREHLINGRVFYGKNRTPYPADYPTD